MNTFLTKEAFEASKNESLQRLREGRFGPLFLVMSMVIFSIFVFHIVGTTMFGDFIFKTLQ